MRAEPQHNDESIVKGVVSGFVLLIVLILMIAIAAAGVGLTVRVWEWAV